MSIYLAANGAIARVNDRPRRFIKPTATGAGDGSSWANAASIANLNGQIALASVASAQGGDVALAADAGTYPETTIALSAGGPVGGRVNVIGMNQDGSAAYATFQGGRARPWTVAGARGNDAGVIWLNAGADRLGFKYLEFKDCGYGCIRLRQSVSDILIEDFIGDNVRAGILNTAASGMVATVSGITIRRFAIDGFSKQAIYLRYDSHDILIEDGTFDSQNQQDPSPWTTGMQFNNSAHDAIVRRVVGRNVYHDNGSGYWNGDIFGSERDNYNFLFEDCEGYDATDAIFDLKSRSTTLLRCKAVRGKRNYRMWGEIDLIDCEGLNPTKLGGSGGSGQVSAYTQSFVRVIGGTWSQTGTSIPFYVENSGFLAIDLVAQANVTKPSGVALSSASGSYAQFSVFDVADTAAAVLSGSTSLTVEEGTLGQFLLAADKPFVAEVQAGGDAAQFSTYGKRLDTRAQDYEAPLHVDNIIHAGVKLRAANNVRSATHDFAVTITDRADGPITPAEAAALATNGCWHEIRPDTVWLDTAMTIPALLGDPVAAISDLSGFDNHALQADEARRGIFAGDGAGLWWLELDGADDFYEVGGAGEFRFAQMTGFSVFDRVDDDEARRYLMSYPRSGTAGTSFNATWALGVIDTLTIWGRVINNGTSASGGASRARFNSASLRSTDGIIRSNGNGYVNMTDVATMTYGASVATAKARLFAHGDPTVGGFFSGRWAGGAIFDVALDDDIRFRIERQLGQLGGINL